MPRLLTLLVALVLSADAALGPETRWTRASTEHFVLSGDAPAADIRQLAARLESLRAVFMDVLPRVDERSLLPTFVIVFGSDRTFGPYRPAGVTGGGYAIHEPFMPCMVLRSDRSGPSDDSFRTIVHEYVHVLSDAPWMPLWLIEGMADYYSTTTLSRDRRRAVLGDRIPTHLAQAARWWVPLSQVLGMARTARLANDESGMSFYAESWLLVHYMTRATPDKGSQIARFIDLLSHGAAEADAFEQAIGAPVKVEAALRRYLGNSVVYGEERTLTRAPEPAAPQPRPMTAGEIDAALGRLLFQLGRGDEAEARLNASISADPSSAESTVTLGVLRLRQGREAEALRSFRRANALDAANVLAAYYQGRMALEDTRPARDPSFEDAYATLRRAAEVRRGLPPEGLGTLGTLAGRLGRLGEAEPMLREASSREPGQPGTRLELANVCLRVGKLREAREILDNVMMGPDPVIAQTARRCFEWLLLAEARARLRSELAGIAGLPDAGPDRAIARTGSFPSPPRLRTPVADEERQLGLLDAVDCPGAEFIARVSTRSGPVSLFTTSLSSVYLSSARDDVSGALGCGPRPRREAVYVTWKGDRRLVAIEFLQADLQPAHQPLALGGSMRPHGCSWTRVTRPDFSEDRPPATRRASTSGARRANRARPSRAPSSAPPAPPASGPS